MLLIPCPWCGPRARSSSPTAATRHVAASGARCADRGVVRLRLPARQSERAARRAVAAQRRLPAVVQGSARHAHARHPRKRRSEQRTAAGARDAVAFVSPHGGIIDRARTLAFEFDGARTRAMPATRSPRRCSPTACISSAAASSITGRAASSRAGVEEPNALVQLARGARTEPNVARDDAGALRRPRRGEPEPLAVAALRRRRASTTSFSRLLPAGFYYKTFMWPPTPRWWLRYEHVIRRAAGMGRARARARSRPLRASVRALRRAGRRRRAAPASPRRVPPRSAARA